MKQQFLIFATRWLGNSLVLAILVVWPNSGVYLAAGGLTIFIAGLILTLANAFLKPLIVLTALPFLFITLGFFTLLTNYLTLYLTARFYPELKIEGWFWTMVAGLAVGLVNYLISLSLSYKTEDNF